MGQRYYNIDKGTGTSKSHHKRHIGRGLPEDIEKRMTDYDNQVRRLQVQLKKANDYISRLIDKKPEYYYSFSALPLLRKWRILNGLNPLHLDTLIILSYYDYFFISDHKYWNMHHTWHNIKYAISDLIKMGYVQVVKVPGKGNKKRHAYVLTKKGRDMEGDYEKYYDEKFEELKNKKLGEFNIFDDDKYFRRIKKPKSEVRKYGRSEGAQNLGRYRVSTLDRWIDQPVTSPPNGESM